MNHEFKRLNPRQRLIVRMAFQGWRYVRIAEKVGVARETVSRVLNSSVAQPGFAQRWADADEWVVNVHCRVYMMNQLRRLPKEGQEVRKLDSLVP